MSKTQTRARWSVYAPHEWNQPEYAGLPVAETSEDEQTACPFADDIVQALAGLNERLEVFSQAVRQNSRSFFLCLASLGMPGLTLNKQIPVMIRPDGESFIATFFDANISSGGDTPEEAVANLQSLIADFFEIAETDGDAELGPSMAKQRCVLLEFVCRS